MLNEQQTGVLLAIEKLFEKNEEWFFTSEACSEFDKLDTLADRTAFINAYLMAVLGQGERSGNWLLKFALLLADEIHKSDLDYAKYPDLIDKQKNPFVASVLNSKYECEEEVFYYTLLAVLHEFSNPLDPDDWIYRYESDFDDFKNIVEKHCKAFESILSGDPSAYEIAENKEKIQMEIIWLFGCESIDEDDDEYDDEEEDYE